MLSETISVAGNMTRSVLDMLLSKLGTEGLSHCDLRFAVTATCGKGFTGKAKVTPCTDNSQEYRLNLGSFETASDMETTETKHDRLCNTESALLRLILDLTF